MLWKILGFDSQPSLVVYQISVDVDDATKKATQSKENISSFADGPAINEILDLLHQQQRQQLIKRITGGSQPERYKEKAIFYGLGDKSVAEYEAKFTELARFIPDYVPSEAQKARRFQQGLKPEIRRRVVAL
ncbi:hypothetical protein AgCh_000411 [Apium graveolens]